MDSQTQTESNDLALHCAAISWEITAGRLFATYASGWDFLVSRESLGIQLRPSRLL